MYFSAALVLVLSAVAARPLDYTIFERVHEVPSGWKQLSSAPAPETTLTLRIHLATRSKVLEQELLAISDPDHARYGEHHSRESLRSFIQPLAGAEAAVVGWLKGAEKEYTVADDVVKVKLTVAEAEELLQTSYATYYREEDDKTLVRTLQYSVPREVSRYIAMIQPTTMFGLRKMRKPLTKAPEPYAKDVRVADVAASCDGATVTLACLAELYGFANYTSSGAGPIGISGFLEQYAQYRDLTLFLRRYKPEAAAGNFSVVSINGGENIQGVANLNNIAEANLDVQYAIGVSFPAENTYYTTAGRPPYIPDLDVVDNDSEPYLEYLEFLLAQDNLPSVFTTSYGESEQTVPLSYRLTVCDLFGRLGARGVSVLFSSGDSGPGWSCRSNDGTNSTKFLPVFPAACPWVTSVGGTVGVNPESAVYFSSGGFSETWERPEYQQAAVDRFLEENPESWEQFEDLFVKTGRGFPDISAQGDSYQVVLNAGIYLIGGTSASSPAVAGIISLVNDYRAQTRKPPLGFLNPLLYKNPQAFTDIVNGRSTGCDGTIWGSPIEGNPAIVPGAGWDAVPGWDPVTGLGTPKFQVLKDIA